MNLRLLKIECVYKSGKGKTGANDVLDKQALQDRVERLENLVRLMADQMTTTNEAQSHSQPSDFGPSPAIDQDPKSNEDEEESMTIVDRLLEAAEADDEGSWSYQGNVSSQSFLKSMQEYVGPSISEKTSKDMSSWAAPLRQALDEAVGGNRHSNLPLPPWNKAQDLLSAPLDEACALFLFIHRPSFDGMVLRLYEKPMSQYDKHERAFLPQLFAALALGSVCRAFPIGSPEKTQALSEG